ncbi:MAG TPA: LytTR family DNA-binding domain-containing protein [Gemmatimonadaceae bacterium]
MTSPLRGDRRRTTVLVVDDEPVARRGLRALLESRDDLQVIGEAANGLTAWELLAQRPVDLLVLDIQMPGLDGIELLRRLGTESAPAVILVTAFDRFAIEAFELAAVDYVIKPFTDERLMLAVDRAVERRDSRGAARTLGRLVDALTLTLSDSHVGVPLNDAASPGARFRERFLVSIGSKDAVIHASEIAWIRASGYYASLITHDGKEYVVRTPLEQLERELDPNVFVRIHRSAIVCLAEVRGLERTAGRGTIVVLKSGTRIPVSRSRREALVRQLGGAGS